MLLLLHKAPLNIKVIQIMTRINAEEKKILVKFWKGCAIKRNEHWTISNKTIKQSMATAQIWIKIIFKKFFRSALNDLKASLNMFHLLVRFLGNFILEIISNFWANDSNYYKKKFMKKWKKCNDDKDQKFILLYRIEFLTHSCVHT